MTFKRNLNSKKYPLTGIALWRWKVACKIFRLGCAVGGRHRDQLEYSNDWRDWYCPNCGWVASDEADFVLPERPIETRL
jgi:hypothetical protein